MTAQQGHQLGYALDSEWYGIGDFPTTMRERLSTLTRDEVNAAVKRHLSATHVSVVLITKDAAGLRDALVSDAPSVVTYDSEKPRALLEEDQLIGAKKLGIAAAKVRITPVADVFAR
jgi:zinc protease